MFVWNYKEGATQDCGSVVNNTLSSPGYPNNYPSNVYCNYKVPIPRGMAMKIYFQDFFVEHLSGAPCDWYDYLEISNDKHERFGEYCGEFSGNAVIVTGNYTVITFESDGRREARGFLIHFTAAPPSPKLLFPDPSLVVRSFPGYELSCYADGVRPIYTALIKNSSTVVFNRTYAPRFRLIKEGNYSCVSTSRYGIDVREFSIVFTGKSCSANEDQSYLCIDLISCHSATTSECVVFDTKQLLGEVEQNILI